MKKVIVTLEYDIADDKLPVNSSEGIHVWHLAMYGTFRMQTTEIKQLYRVQLPTDRNTSKQNISEGRMTEEGYLAMGGKALMYTKGEAIKKARSFGGKIVKC